MAFWGVEVKPGKPYTHPSSETVGRLRLSQATLGFGVSQTKCLVQCNVGSRSPLLLCCLMPDKSEYCHLELEFDEDDETVFSVIGPRSVFLTGYYMIANHSHKHRGFDDSSESYGEDVGKSDTEKSNECSDEDEYDDSFINDNAEELSPPSPAFSSEEMGEVMHVKNSRDKKGSWRGRRLRKFQISDSEDDGSIRQQNVDNGDAAVKLVGIEDEDNIPISSLTRRGKDRKAGKQEKVPNDEVTKVVVDQSNNSSDQTSEKSKKAKGVVGKDPKREPVIQNTSVSATVEGLQPDEEEIKQEKKREKKVKSVLVESIEVHRICKEKRQVDETKDEVAEVAVDQSNNRNDKIIEKSNDVNADTDPKSIQNTSMPSTLEGLQPDEERLKVPAFQNTSVSVALEGLQPDDEELKVEKKKGKKREKKRNAKRVESDEDHIICTKNLQDDETKDEVTKTAVDQSNNSSDQIPKKTNEINGVDTDPKREPGILNTSVPASLENMQPDEEELKMEKKKGKISEKKRKALHVESIEDYSICKEKLQVDETKGYCQEPADKKPEVDAPQSDERNTKRKKRKSKGNEDLVSVEKKAMSSKDGTMTFLNGLKVEDLELGNPDGEVACVGRKLKIHYTGKLKDGGHVYETRNQSNPFKFRLGKGNTIEGLELGLEGMRVGGRRRLTIPPELGYGSKGNADSVPPNSWLRVDIELINAR